LQTGEVEEALRMLEAIAKEAPDVVEVHVQLATAYNRLKRKEDAQREREIIDRLNAEAQAKQRGSAPSVEGAGR
jgi:thioredoxin-like negative regulator of GroEL